jgi:hypothetical protein
MAKEWMGHLLAWQGSDANGGRRELGLARLTPYYLIVAAPNDDVGDAAGSGR